MSHLRIAAGIHQPSWEQVSRIPDQLNGARWKPLVRGTIGISAPFTVQSRCPPIHGSNRDTRAVLSTVLPNGNAQDNTDSTKGPRSGS